MKKIITVIIVVLVVIIGGYFIIKNLPTKSGPEQTVTPNPSPSESENGGGSMATSTISVPAHGSQTLIGKSVQDRDLTAFHYGSGERELVFIGGIHGGYEWNTVLVAGQLMNFLETNPTMIPAKVRVTVIPVLNPDGLNKVIGTTTIAFTKDFIPRSQNIVEAGRFNGRTVDLNRNFDCDWQKNAKWQNRDVSGGDFAFSEPESQAIKAYVEKNKPTAIVTWYSAAGGVFASSCHNGVSADTANITKLFATASGYPAHDDFNFYEITGDMVNWFAKMNIPAISVLLTNHTDTEWTKNLAGIKALFTHYAQ